MVISVAPRRFRFSFASTLLFALSAAPAAAIELIAKVGDQAPGFAGGTTITSFVEPPSISDGGFAVFHVTVTGGVHAILRWHRTTGLQRVAAGTDVVAFATGNKTLAFLETPIADESGWVAFTATLSDGARGMVVWEPPSTLHAVAEVGQTVSIECDTVGGGNCGPILAPLGTMATFADRKGAIFRLYGDTIHEVEFRGSVTTSGTPDAVWRWALIDDLPDPPTFWNLASSFEWADGTEAATYFDDFTDLAACGDTRFVLGTVSHNAPYTAYDFNALGNARALQDRAEAPDMVARKDLHCANESTFAYVGGRTDEPFDGDVTKKGVWIGTTQLYSNTVTAAAGLTGSTLGTPLGQALTRHDPPFSVFAANILGSTWNGRAGVWRGNGLGALELLLYELEPLSDPVDSIDAIWAVHVGGTNANAFHVRTTSLDQAILRAFGANVAERVLTTGDTFPVAGGGTYTVDSFWTLGGTFGSDPVVTGTGQDGQLSALNARGEMALLMTVTPGGAGPEGGSAVTGAFQVVIDPLIFADSFDLDGYCVWSGQNGGPDC